MKQGCISFSQLQTGVFAEVQEFLIYRNMEINGY